MPHGNLTDHIVSFLASDRAPRGTKRCSHAGVRTRTCESPVCMVLYTTHPIQECAQCRRAPQAAPCICCSLLETCLSMLSSCGCQSHLVSPCATQGLHSAGIRLHWSVVFFLQPPQPITTPRKANWCLFHTIYALLCTGWVTSISPHIPHIQGRLIKCSKTQTQTKLDISLHEYYNLADR